MKQYNKRTKNEEREWANHKVKELMMKYVYLVISASSNVEKIFIDNESASYYLTHCIEDDREYWIERWSVEECEKVVV